MLEELSSSPPRAGWLLLARHFIRGWSGPNCELSSTSLPPFPQIELPPPGRAIIIVRTVQSTHTHSHTRRGEVKSLPEWTVSLGLWGRVYGKGMEEPDLTFINATFYSNTKLISNEIFIGAWSYFGRYFLGPVRYSWDYLCPGVSSAQKKGLVDRVKQP